MTLLLGAYTWEPSGEAAALAERLARQAAGPGEPQPRLVARTPRLACYAVERPDSASRAETWTGADGSVCVVAGRLLGADAAPRERLRPALEADPASAVGLDGCWIALSERPDGSALRFLSDPLGVAWLYLARHARGCLFSGDYAALLRALPEPPEVDEETALVTLALGYAPDERTCSRGVEMLPPGSLVEVSAGGTRTRATIAPSYGDGLAGLAEREKRDRLDAVLHEGLEAWCAGAPEPIVLSVSGGSDSRFALAHLLRSGRPFSCVTFGHPRSPDVRSARSVLRRAGLETSLYYDGDATSWDSWTRVIERLGTTGGFQWSGWADAWLAFVRTKGRAAILGYLGDAFSGKHLVDRPEHRGDWVENWISWSLDEGWSGSPYLTQETQRTLLASVRARIRAMAEGLAVAAPHQRALHLDLIGRQRRHVAAQPNLMARVVDSLPFFYTRAQSEFWTNLPYDDLRGQRLYLDYAAERFPRLFPPPRRPSLVERAVGVATNVAAARDPRLRRWLAPPEIDLARHVVDQRAGILRLLDGAAPMIDRWFDRTSLRRAVEGFPDGSPIGAGQVLRLANLLLVLQAGRASGAPPDREEGERR